MPVLDRRRTLAGFALLALAGGRAEAAPGVAAPEDMSLGDAKAPVSVVEYASLSCGHCARFHEAVFPAFKAKYVDTGRVRYTIKEMLTPPRQVAAAGFLLARCGGPSKYFKIVDEVLRSQPRWSDTQIRSVFAEIAQANGISEAQFEACLADQEALAALNERVRKAVAEDGVRGTPTFFVNGEMVRAESGVPTLAELDAAIAAARAGRG